MDDNMVHSLQSNIDNPLAQKRDDHQSNPMHQAIDNQALEAQEETIKAQQEEIMRLKKENQAKMLSSFSSSSKKLKNKSRKIKSAKKTFDTGGDVVLRSERHDSKHEEIDADDKESML